VHHVASVYPIEVQLARIIADGKPVEDVTWDVVAELNAKHAGEHSEVTKSEALDLLWRNSREAAGAVRAFTDGQLNRAAPFSLSFGAPVTAQFVIEDHAVRHSWHHLARIRTAVHELGEVLEHMPVLLLEDTDSQTVQARPPASFAQS
jgi:hypothetical protein